MSGGGRGSSSPIPGTHGANLQRMLSYEEEPSCGDATPPHAAGNMNNVSASGAGNKSSTTPNRVTALNTLAASPRNMIVRPLKSILRNWKPSGPSVSSSEKDGDTTTAAGANRRVYIEGGSRSPEAASTPDVISGTRFLHGGQGPRNPEPGGAMSMRNSNGVDLRREEQEEHLQARLGGGQIFRRAGSTSTFTSDDIRNMSIGDRNPFPSPRHTVLPSMGETPQTSGPLGHFLHPAQPVTSTAGGPVANIEGANTNKVTPSNLNGGRTTSTTSASGGAGEHSKQHQQQHSTAASTPGGLAGGGSQHHSQQHYLLAPLNSPKQEDEGLCLDASVRSPSRMRTGSTGSDISASGSKQERPAALAETTTAATPSPTRAFFNKAATSQTSVMNDNRYAGSGAGRESGRSGDDRFRNGDTTPHLCVGAQTPSNAGYLSTKHAKEVLRGTLTPLFHKNHVKEKRDTVVREAEQLRLALRKQYVINPDESAMATVIQSVSAFCLFIVCFLTPYEVAFLDMRIGSTVFWLNRLIDVSFTADMILQFFLLYRVNTLAGERLLVVSQTQIAAHYLRTWFLVDFLAVFPFWAFEIWGMTNAASAGEGIGLLRVLRLLKLGKVIKSLRMLRERAIHIEITYYRGQLITFIFVLILAAHWMACAWGAAGLRFGGPFYYNPNLEDVVLNNVYENYEWSKTWVGRESGLANSTASSSSGARQLSSAHENMSAPAATSASKLDASTLSPSAQGTSGRDVGRAFFETLNGSGFLDTARASEEKLLQDRAAELEFAGIGKGSWSVSRPVLEDEREDGTLNRHPGEDSGLSRNARENKNLQVQHADFFVTLAVSPWRYVGWHLLRNPFGVQAWGATKLVGDSVLLGDGTAIRKRILQMQPGEQKIHDVMGEAAGTLMWSGHTRTTIEDINNKLDHDPNPQKIRRPDVSSRRRGSALWEYITANAPLSLADYISLSTSPERQRITSGIRRGLSMKSVGEVHLVDLLGGSRAIIDNNRVSSSDTSEQRRQLISGIPEPGFTTDSLWAGRRRLSWMQVYCGCVKCRTAKMCKQCNVCLESPWQIYVGSLHFSLMTLTSIGYGDISATHTAERYFW
ncbi:unnamed protein product [Amoebophrya sp. A25]|nr:unnamed protein product [Amoebophrya sp. A25]|eukprot:GSA25T00015662001.1